MIEQWNNIEDDNLMVLDFETALRVRSGLERTAPAANADEIEIVKERIQSELKLLQQDKSAVLENINSILEVMEEGKEELNPDEKMLIERHRHYFKQLLIQLQYNTII